MRRLLKSKLIIGLVIFVTFFCINQSVVHALDPFNLTPEEREMLGPGWRDPGTALLDRGVQTMIVEPVKQQLGDWVDDAFQAIATFLLWLGSKLLYLSAIIFNFIVYITIIQIAAFINLPAVSTSWATFRDLANICFIFILLYISIQTIIKGSQFNTKELLGKVIFTAIILNFSLFCTKVVIDSSNILALAFYNKISVAGVSTSYLNPGSTKASLDGGLATAFSSKLQLTTIYGVKNAEEIPKGAVQPLILGLFGFILMTIVAIIFFIASTMLVARLIMLVIYCITSPIAFMGAILPSTRSKITNKWWAGLIGQAFMAPVFFIFTWVTLNIIHSDGFGQFARENTNISWVQIFTSKADILAAAQFIFNYILIIGLMVATIVATKKVSASSGGFAVSVSKSVGKFATGAVFGAAGAVGRRTIGATGEWADRTGKFSGSNIFSRNLRGLSKRAATSSFDARKSKGVASLFEQGGIAVKPTGKGGYRESAKKATDKTLDRISSMSPEAQSKYLGLDEDGNPTKWGGKHFGVGGRRIKSAVLEARNEDKTKWDEQDAVHTARLKEVENMPKGTEKLKRQQEIRRLREKDLAERKKRDRTRVVDVVRSEKKNKAERDKAERERKIIEKLDEEEKAEKKKKKKEGEEENN